jgi:high-affinity iron transporter
VLVLSTISLAISGCEGASPPAGVLSSPSAQVAGATLFATRCAICHGTNGDGQGIRHAFMDPPPANLTLPPWSELANAAQTHDVIRNGVRGTAMASWASLGDHQIWELVAYIISLKSL